MASFLPPNRQTRTELVGCGLARPAPNWSGGWQRIINRSLGARLNKDLSAAFKSRLLRLFVGCSVEPYDCPERHVPLVGKTAIASDGRLGHPEHGRDFKYRRTCAAS